MTDNFNTYINRIDSEAWRELCVSKGTLRRYAKGEEFVSIVGLDVISGSSFQTHSNMWQCPKMARNM